MRRTYSKAVFLAMILVGSSFGAGFHFAGKSVGHVLGVIGLQGEAARVGVEVKKATLLREKKYEELQRFYDIGIQCAPKTLGLYLQTADANLVSDIEAAIVSAEKYNKEHSIGECESAQ